MTFLIGYPSCGPAGGSGVQLRRRDHAPRRSRRERPRAGQYLFFRRNVKGWQEEWWLHRDGCGKWFLAQRHTVTNEVRRTSWPADREAAPA
ncbi:MAG: sarcosine oxidase subunit delta [Actinomycetota bacterium]